MKTVHWSLKNGSGMHRVAESIAAAERVLGLDASNVDCSIRSPEWDAALDADIHVVHTHFPDELRPKTKTGAKTVWVAHGTPDHVFQSSVEAGVNWSYGFANPLQLMFHWLRNADARVTFWDRHKWIYDRMVDRGTVVHSVPLGVDRTFWAGGASRGKYQGAPSVWTGENQHYIKWAYDLHTLWPAVREAIPGAVLHSIYQPKDMHWWVAPWVYANGCAYAAHISPISFPWDELRNIWKSVDFFIGLVRYGDMNQLSLQANAAGATTISYAGNPHSDYWITEGDQREMAKHLLAILRGETPKRDKTPVSDISETALAMKNIYEGLLA